ncbi:hypothetical protein PT974_10154 [Cladobotryum mycophilum]|uniref:EKC/KEOPS complex subunit GON7 n=1 Tax=Cladobotryum mycophilum TaxID=491253 RepID=A0ABR0S916_9HYPO
MTQAPRQLVTVRKAAGFVLHETGGRRFDSDEGFRPVSLHFNQASVHSYFDDKSAYLSSLRAAASSAQDTINKELTSRMEADKAAEAASGARLIIDEDKEEENYGEEVQEEED